MYIRLNAITTMTPRLKIVKVTVKKIGSCYSNEATVWEEYLEGRHTDSVFCTVAVKIEASTQSLLN